MKQAIRYFTKSKKGNTKKIADFVSEKLGLEALTVESPLEEKVDRLILINAMYATDIDKEIKLFLHENKDKIGEVVNINSAASGASTLKAVKKACDKNGIAVSDKEFHTVASWIFLNKGRPNEEDFARLEAFLEGLKAE
ncbi:MAG: flavodoxin [Erysipelotrichaceae bacterium]|nr:flavodoxin [Erysipelotrichaceae bacterium]